MFMGLTTYTYKGYGYLSSQNKHMDAVQLTSQLRYVPLEDEEGRFGLFIVHDESGRVRYTVEVTDDTQLWAALDSFRCDPVGVDL